tara:strand:+ start:75 stop:287 length:213 start_codon:yes stop_codon:yes gene_type:complete
VVSWLGTAIGKQMLNGKMGFKEKCEQKASEYADIVARGGVGVTYNEAYEYYMKKYLPTYKKKGATNAKTH